MSTSDAEKAMSQTRRMFGRRVIKTSAKSITADNVLDVLGKALAVHAANRSEIDYLWNYYKGDQPALYRTKEVRPEICNQIVENHANEIVRFKVGYLCGEPIQYVGRTTSDEVTKQIALLNEWMFSEGKAFHDRDLVEWQMVCGTAFRLVLPDDAGQEDEAPFEIYTLDPRDTFVVYSNEVGNKPLMGVKYAQDENGVTRYSIYTDDYYYLVEDSIINVAESKPHALGMVPIFEYPANNARLGAFEVVLPKLDQLNSIESNRMDGIDQIIQAFIKFINCDISKEEYEEFLQLGAIKVKSVEGADADVDTVTTELNQDQTQTTKDDCYQAVLSIAGVPNQSGGYSTSDTGAAVMLREGWTRAEAFAKSDETMIKRSENPMLKLVLRICRDLKKDFTLRISDIDMKFTRRNYEDIQTKAQVLDIMLKNEKIHPLLAYLHCGMFTDPENAYMMGEKYQAQEQVKQQKKEGQTDEENSVSEQSHDEIPPSFGERK